MEAKPVVKTQADTLQPVAKVLETLHRILA